MSALSELFRSANAGRHSARAIARIAQDRGHSINHDTAARYLRGDHGRPDEATLLAFADVLDLDMRDVRAAAGLPAELTTPYSPPPESSRLTRRQRKAVDEVIRAMLEPGTAATPLRTPRAGQTGTRPARAARRGPAEPPSG